MEINKVDFISQDKEYFSATRKPGILILGVKTYISLEGQGTPESVDYQVSIETIYSAAFQLKFLLKGRDKDFKVSKLECLWWVEQGKDFMNTPMKEWRWKLLIRIPDFITSADVNKVIEKIVNERGLREADKLQIFSMTEGKCVQVLHYGPYNEIGTTYDRLLEYLSQTGLEQNGAYHEIYISDPNRTSPDKLRTIVRQPVK